MRSVRTMQIKVLGYQIDRVEEFEDVGLPRSLRYEVLCPRTGAVLSNHATQRRAERAVIARELHAVAMPIAHSRDLAA